MKKNIFIIIIFLLISGFVVNLPEQTVPAPAARKSEENASYVKIRGAEVKVEVADTLVSQAKGLSGRDSLPQGSGMLFIFKSSGKHAFWMQDMNFAIDIIWIDENWKVVHIEKNVLPESFPNTFKSAADAKYVLEVPAGFAKENNVRLGDAVLFTK